MINKEYDTIGTNMVYTSSSSGNNNNNNSNMIMSGSSGENGNTVSNNNNNNSTVQVISSMHLDYIHDVVLDVYGRRMATCSGDRFVRVWELTTGNNNNDDNNNDNSNTTNSNSLLEHNGTNNNTANSSGRWVLSSQWQAHRGSISSLCWSHPEFGNLLATCGSSDHDVKIWEEMTPSSSSSSSSTTTSSAAATGTGAGAGTAATTSTSSTSSLPYSSIISSGPNSTYISTNTTTSASTNSSMKDSSPTMTTTTTTTTTNTSVWQQKSSLTDARKAVTCCEFAPKHWGLKIAIGSADNYLRIYEAVDIMNLSEWSLSTSIQCFLTTNTNSTTDSTPSGTSNQSRMGNSGLSGLPSNTGTTTATTNSKYNVGVTSLSWCTGRFEPPTIVVGGVCIQIYRYNETVRSNQLLLQLPSSSGGNATSISRMVLDVSWAPNVGRRYHYIASAEEDTLRIYKLNRQITTVQQPTTNSSSTTQQGLVATAGGQPTTSAGGQQQVQINTLVYDTVQVITTNAWRCQWNVTGTVLASSGDCGIVQLWKADYQGIFGQVGKVVQGDYDDQ